MAAPVKKVMNHLEFLQVYTASGSAKIRSVFLQPEISNKTITRENTIISCSHCPVILLGYYEDLRLGIKVC